MDRVSLRFRSHGEFAFGFPSCSSPYLRMFSYLFFLSLQGSILRSDPSSLGETLGSEPRFLELASRRSDRILGFSHLAGSRNSLAFATVSWFLENGVSGPSVPEALGQQTVLTVSSTGAGQASTNLHRNPGDCCDLRHGVCFCVEFKSTVFAALLLRLWSGRQLLRWTSCYFQSFFLPTRDHGSLLFGIQQSGRAHQDKYFSFVRVGAFLREPGAAAA